MKIGHITALWCILGAVSAFMPWVYYPKVDGKLYGYLGDGIVTTFIFAIILFLTFLELIKKKDILSISITKTILSLLIIYIVASAINLLRNQQNHFTTDNPFIASATAGFRAGYGLYITGFSGLAVLIFSLLGIFFHKKTDAVSSGQVPKTALALTLSSIIVFTFLVVYGIFSFSTPPSKKDLETVFRRDVNEMGNCLIRGDYNCFIDYNHPMIVQSYGGKQVMADLLKTAMADFKKNNTTYSKINYETIEQMETEGRNIQAIIKQKVTIIKNSNTTFEDQKVLCVSENNGDQWFYINLNGISKQKLKKFYPTLNNKLKI